MTDKEIELIHRVGNLIAGDWSGDYFDGRDILRMLTLIICGELDKVEKEIIEYENLYVVK